MKTPYFCADFVDSEQEEEDTANLGKELGRMKTKTREVNDIVDSSRQASMRQSMRQYYEEIQKWREIKVSQISSFSKLFH